MTRPRGARAVLALSVCAVLGTVAGPAGATRASFASIAWTGAQARPPMPPGTGSISGRVTAADTGQPIAGALIEIVIFENMSSRFRQVLTDAQGRFVLSELPPGHFQIQASAARFMSMHFGQLDPGPPSVLNPPRVIQLDDKQQFTEANFTLTHYSAIEGTVVDELGDPAPNVTVQVSQLTVVGGVKRLMPVNANRDAGPVRPTDDLGHFRAAGLPPGRYYVEALTGAFADPSAAGGFAITYYPGTVDVAAAKIVTVPAGQDVKDVSFALVPAKTAVVGGTLVDGAGNPLGGGSMLLMPADAEGHQNLLVMIRAASGPDGTFAFRNVPPGQYTIQAFGKPVSNAGNLAASAFGYLSVRVGTTDTSHLTVRVPEPRNIRGRITFETDGPTPQPKPGTVQIGTRPVEFESAPIAGGPSPYTVHDDWTFEVNAMSGRRLVAVSAPGWLLKSVRHNGLDVTDSPLDLRESDVDDVELVMTTRATTVSATVAVPADRKPSDYNLLVFSSDPSKWTIWSRYVTIARPSQQGTFVVRGLPPGQYFAAAVGALSGGEWQDPEFLQQLRDAGDVVSFTVSETDAATLHLTAKK